VSAFFANTPIFVEVSQTKLKINPNFYATSTNVKMTEVSKNTIKFRSFRAQTAVKTPKTW
jgi:hypothetical protein